VARDPGSAVRCEIVLPEKGCAAGGMLVGHVTGVVDPVPVALVRVEHRPRGESAFAIAHAETARGSGAFELAVPDGALPTASGLRCALSYRVQAGARGTLARAPVEVSARARPHVGDPGPLRADRLIPDWDARHFHIELSEAALHGGGVIAGRVHRHGAWRSGAMTVDVSCREAWRLPVRGTHGVPSWGGAWLWRHAAMLGVDPDATWASFELHLPSRLPPAVEARTIAWRYEILVPRRTRHWPDETAARTPLLHEELLPIPGLTTLPELLANIVASPRWADRRGSADEPDDRAAGELTRAAMEHHRHAPGRDRARRSVRRA
jgi:hypothetical protein